METPRELITEEQAGTLLAIVSTLLLLAGVALAAAARQRPPLRPWALAAGLGALAWPLWGLYGLVVNTMGLDSVAALAVNVAIFTGLGLTAGLLFRRLAPSNSPAVQGREDA